MSADPSAALSKLISVCLCVKKRNTPEFMAYFADQINAACAAIGVGPQVEWPGKWGNEFHYLAGADPAPEASQP